MITLVFQLYGALCFFSLAAFLILASVAKLRPDLDEEAFDIRTLEKLSSREEFVNALPVADPIIKHSLRSAPPRPFKPSKRLQGRPHSIHTRKLADPRRHDRRPRSFCFGEIRSTRRLSDPAALRLRTSNRTGRLEFGSRSPAVQGEMVSASPALTPPR
jgi:hypothetical protein